MEISKVEIDVLERHLETVKCDGSPGVIIGWYILEKIIKDLNTLHNLESLTFKKKVDCANVLAI